MAFVRDFDNKDSIISARHVVKLELAGTDVNAKLSDGSVVKVGQGADEDKARALLNSLAQNTFLRA